jgi:hypothetical protein
MQIMERGRRARQVVYLIHFDVEGEADVVAVDFEIWIREQVLDVTPSPGENVIGTDYLVPLFEKPFSEVGAYESGSSRNEDSLPH